MNLSGWLFSWTEKWTCYIFKPILKRVREVNYCSPSIDFQLKEGFLALGTACGQGKYKVKGMLPCNALLIVL